MRTSGRVADKQRIVFCVTYAILPTTMNDPETTNHRPYWLISRPQNGPLSLTGLDLVSLVK
jgi:hypothetical protein